MNPSHDRHLRDITCAAFTRSPALARREQARVLAELVSAFRRWARDARIPSRHAGHTGAAGAKCG